MMVPQCIVRAISVYLGAAGFVLAVCGTAHADTVTLFSNFAPGATFPPGGYFFGYTEANDEDVPEGRATPAVPFVPSQDALFDSLTVALQFEYRIGPGALEVSLYEGDGLVPGNLLERFSRTSPYTGGDPLLSFSSVLHPSLVAGNSYWVSVTTTGKAEGAWFVSPEPHGPAQFPMAEQLSSGMWRSMLAVDQRAFRVTGIADAAPVPEPGTVALLGIGLAGLFRARLGRARTR